LAARRWPGAPESGWSVRAAPATPASEANREKLAQVFINLISNAIKYNTNGSPRVVVSSVVRKGVYEAHVADNGPGIPESERERIFLNFARGPMPREAGAGLGLAISRQIVERLGGSLSLARSKAGGADFIVRLTAVHGQ
jgi:signal transduction histidine kinase